MELIAVIDLRGGQVVGAKPGRSRGLYPFLRAPFMPQTRHVVKRLYCDYGFRSVYVADLDALQGRGRRWHKKSVLHLARCFPHVTFYVDGAFSDWRALRAFGRGWCRNIVPVVATECLRSVSAWTRMKRLCGGRLVLSLDYRNKRLLGGTHIDRAVGLWSALVLVMGLNTIGRGGGAVSEQALAARHRAGGAWQARQIILGGGVGNVCHLREAQTLGFAGVLLSSVVYRGRMTPQQLKRWNQGLALEG